jgi:hypothetical protein
LALRKLAKKVCVLLAVSVENSFHQAAIQIVRQCDVVVPLPEGILVDANSGHWLVGLPGFPSSDGSVANVPRLSQMVFRIPWAPSAVWVACRTRIATRSKKLVKRLLFSPQGIKRVFDARLGAIAR